MRTVSRDTTTTPIYGIYHLYRPLIDILAINYDPHVGAATNRLARAYHVTLGVGANALLLGTLSTMYYVTDNAVEPYWDDLDRWDSRWGRPVVAPERTGAGVSMLNRAPYAVTPMINAHLHAAAPARLSGLIGTDVCRNDGLTAAALHITLHARAAPAAAALVAVLWRTFLYRWNWIYAIAAPDHAGVLPVWRPVVARLLRMSPLYWRDSFHLIPIPDGTVMFAAAAKRITFRTRDATRHAAVLVLDQMSMIRLIVPTDGAIRTSMATGLAHQKHDNWRGLLNTILYRFPTNAVSVRTRLCPIIWRVETA